MPCLLIGSIVICREVIDFEFRQFAKFVIREFEKTKQLQEQYPYLDFSKELEYFNK